jgi:hypothetical protein
VIDSEQGVPQGSPLSPLLSNIVLTSSTVSSPGVATGPFAMRMTPRCTCQASERDGG